MIVCDYVFVVLVCLCCVLIFDLSLCVSGLWVCGDEQLNVLCLCVFVYLRVCVFVGL